MENINDLIRKHELLYVIFAKEDGIIIDIFGDRAALKYDGVVNQYFGDEERIISTSKFLLGKQLPQSAMQGNQCCLLTVLENSIFSGIFFLDSSNIFVRRKRLKVIQDDILNLNFTSYL